MQQERNWPQIIEAMCAVLLVFITAFYTYYSRRQAVAAINAANAAKSAATTADETLKEIRKGGNDTHDLAQAAKDQADATKKVAERALAQANATNALARQAKRSADIADRAMAANIESASEDRRSWVGLRDFRCDGCTSDADGTLIIGEMFGVMENTGKTPAIQMVVSAVWTDRKGADPIPDYDTIQAEINKRDPYAIPSHLSADLTARIAKEMEIMKRFTEPPKTVLPPNAARVLPIIGRAKMGRNKIASIEERKIFYVVGKIVYFNTWEDKPRTTRFCLMNDFGSDFRFCPTGNDMN